MNDSTAAGTSTGKGAANAPLVPEEIKEVARLASDHWLGMVDPARPGEGDPPYRTVVGQRRSGEHDGGNRRIASGGRGDDAGAERNLGRGRARTPGPRTPLDARRRASAHRNCPSPGRARRRGSRRGSALGSDSTS